MLSHKHLLVQQVDNQGLLQLSKTTLASESSDYFGDATALAVELASEHNVRERFLVMHSLAFTLTHRRRALPMEANLESCMPHGRFHLRWPWRFNRENQW